MKCVLCLFIITLCVQAGFVELKNGQFYQGSVVWVNGNLQTAGKTFSPADVNSFEIESPLAPGDGEYLVFKMGLLSKGNLESLIARKIQSFLRSKELRKKSRLIC